MNDINSLRVTHGSDTGSSAGVANSLSPCMHPEWVCAGLRSLTTATNMVSCRRPRLRALRSTNEVFDGRGAGSVRRFPDRIASRATRKTREKLTKPMTRTLQKNIRVTPGQWNRIENAAKEREVSANRLVVELAMEALDRREWPRTELEIQLLRSSMFTAQAIARDMIAAGREDEVEEIRRNISATTLKLLD